MTFAWIVLAAPLAGVLINGLLGCRYLRDRAHWVAVPAAGLSAVAGLGVFFQAWGGGVQTSDLYTWLAVGDLRIPLGIQVDALSAMMVLVVTFVGFWIHVYSIGYMHGDPGYARFFTYLNLFMLFMLILVLADNYLLLFLGWEGVGLCSYLLIGYWYQRRSATTAGNKAFIVNRVGDAGFLLGLFLLATTFGTLTYAEVFARAPEVLPLGGGLATAIALLLFVGATGKSAQVPLFVWLPDAMEGPTPVSALIHAATMVTAGVYMVARSAPLFLRAPGALEVVAWIGGITAFLGATIALVQTDIKRVIAYSTISQLGYMFLGLGVGAFASGMFHLLNQAFFKALLFLAAGSVIHGLHGEQDLRKMGGLLPHMRLTGITFLIAAAANAGIFPFNGFWSKDEILFAAFAGGRYGLWLLGLLTAFFSAAYIFRCYFLAFAGAPRYQGHPHESPRVMTVPLVVLAAFTAGLGIVGIPPDRGLLHHFLASAVPASEETVVSVVGALPLALLSLAVAVAGAGAAYLLCVRRPDLAERLADHLRIFHALLRNKYFVDDAYGLIFVRGTVALGGIAHQVDARVVDGAVNGAAAATVLASQASHFNDSRIVDGLVNRIADWIQGAGLQVRKIQTGLFHRNLLAMALGIFAIAVVFLFL
jgi:NADH-quinone oxidoreductase subunit L